MCFLWRSARWRNNAYKKWEVLVVGDTNGHLGQQHNPKCSHKMNSNGMLYKNFVEENQMINLNVTKKNSMRCKDKSVNSEGRNLCSGRWTYMENCKMSIVDYAACTQDFMDWDVSMRIYDKGEISFVSDHSPILIWWKDKT